MRYSSFGDAVMARKILVGYYISETCGGKNFPDDRSLVISMLQHQSTSRHQVLRTVQHDTADIGQAIVSRD